MFATDGSQLQAQLTRAFCGAPIHHSIPSKGVLFREPPLLQLFKALFHISRLEYIVLPLLFEVHTVHGETCECVFGAIGQMTVISLTKIGYAGGSCAYHFVGHKVLVCRAYLQCFFTLPEAGA